MQLTLTHLSPARVSALGERVNGDRREVVFSFAFSPTSEKRQRELAERCGVRHSRILALIAEATSAGLATADFTPPSMEFEITLRGRTETSVQGTPFVGPDPCEVLRRVLDVADYPHSEPVFQWQGKDILAALDIDYHAFPFNERPTPDKLRALASTIQPAPVAYHVSHGRGVKLYYVATNGYTAEELAAAGAMYWLGNDGRATAEIKRESRHPRYPRLVGSHVQLAGPPTFIGPTSGAGLSAVGQLFGREASVEAISEFLSERGLALMGRYDHSHCPIDPERPSHGTPVLVGDAGIHCHSCAGLGISLGRRKAGYVSYSTLIGGCTNEVYSLARHCVHWTHAEHALRHYLDIPDALLKPAYRAALKLVHGPDDPRVPAVFSVVPIARVGGAWKFVNDRTMTTLPKASKRTIESIPATWIVERDEAGEHPRVSLNPITAEIFGMTPKDLIAYGYDDLRPVKGMKMWGRKLPYGKGMIPIPDSFAKLRPEARPKVVPYTAATVAEARGLVERVFPGIDWRYVETLVALRGLVEAGMGFPYLCVVGPAGSGKSQTPHIVAGLLGDRATETLYTTDDTRLRQSIMEGISVGSFVIIDEVFKTAERNKRTSRQALDPVLTLTPDSKSHQLYVGPVELGGTAVAVFTDVTCPQDVKDDMQLARRFTFLRLVKRNDWRASCNAVGLAEPHKLRELGPDYNRAADTLCSYWADRFFDTLRTYEELAVLGGATILEHSTEFADSSFPLRVLFDEVAKAPPVSGTDAARYSGAHGWKIIKQADATPLREAWDDIADGMSGPPWVRSRRLDELDWTATVAKWRGSPPSDTVYCDYRSVRGNMVYIRFRMGDFALPAATNGDILAS